jgi:hypothetical protein
LVSLESRTECVKGCVSVLPVNQEQSRLLPTSRLLARNNFQFAGLQRRSGTFATWAEITYVRRLIGIDQSWLGGCQQVESSSRVKNLMQAQIVAIAAPQTAEDNRR